MLPLTYAYEALEEVSRRGSLGTTGTIDVVVTVATALGSLALGALTLRRRTP